MKYLEGSFTLPTTGVKMDDLTYQLRVGAITEEEYKRLRKAERGDTRGAGTK